MDAKLFLMTGCLAGIVSACMHEKSDSASDIQQAVHTLVLEADSLMQSDSLFWNQPIDKSHPQVCIHDSLIRQKLDSALALRPDKQIYLLKYRYLLQSWRLQEVLDLLREMDGCMSDSMSSELLHLKAVLEDYKGDTLTARRDFLRADSAYTIKIQQVAQDSLMYGFARIEKALNLSLMQMISVRFGRKLRFMNACILPLSMGLNNGNKYQIKPLIIGKCLNDLKLRSSNRWKLRNGLS